MRRRRRPTVRPSPPSYASQAWSFLSLPSSLSPSSHLSCCNVVVSEFRLSLVAGFISQVWEGDRTVPRPPLASLLPPLPLGAHVCTLKCAVFGCCNTKFHKNLSVYNMNVWGMLRLRCDCSSDSSRSSSSAASSSCVDCNQTLAMAQAQCRSQARVIANAAEGLQQQQQRLS